MPIFEKLRRIFNSNINDLLDRVEDPEKILNQLLEDMQHELKEVKIQVALRRSGTETSLKRSTRRT